MKNRQLAHIIDELCFGDHKMAFISGPRQCGKTTLMRMLRDQRGLGAYYNWDEVTFRRTWVKDPTKILPVSDNERVPILILDGIPWLPVEVKMGSTSPSPNWRRFLPSLPCCCGVQVCLKPDVDRTFVEGKNKVRFVSAAAFLSKLP